MSNEEVVRWLRIPLYKLYFIKDLSDFDGLHDRQLTHLQHEYNKVELEAIVRALRWGVDNPDYDFKSLLPDLHHSNQSIHHYICVLCHQLSNLSDLQKRGDQKPGRVHSMHHK